ncbi:MAG: signal recognition particle-docking protein FtsY [Alphaproteobacteria bacterium]
MNLFSRLSSGLKKTSSQLGDGIGAIFTERKLDAATLAGLEELLIAADIGVAESASIVAGIAQGRHDKDIDAGEIKALLASAIARRLEPYAAPLKIDGPTPCVVFAVGVNGNGKTTTLGKLAHRYVAEGKKVLLVAADTFRAAAVEQLAEWAKRSGAGFVHGAANADPASVVYGGVEQGLRDKVDLILIDTAGRLHTKDNLMAELAKMTKAARKLIPDAPHAVLQVLDATTGQNALSQVKAFREAAGVTGLIVTKLDGTARAGIVVALGREFGLPIHAIGVGEGAEDLQPFDADAFAKALVG